MAGKTLPSSNGYFNKEMLAILKKGEEKNTKKNSTKKSANKNKSK